MLEYFNLVSIIILWAVIGSFFYERRKVTNKIILWDTRIGRINCHLQDIMNERNINIYQLARLANLRYEIIDRYYDNKVMRYDSVVLSKLCYSLDCSISDILKYDV